MRKNIPTPKPGKSHRDAVRRLLRNARKASLATAMSNNGAPYASLVTIATDQDGSPILLLSGLADHTRNLATEPRASLLVEETEGLDNPQTGPRATIMGAIHRITDSQERERAKRRFLARHPSAAQYVGFGDFAFYRMSVEQAHYVGGFARAVWIDDGPSILTPPTVARALAEAEPTLIAHMNQDHAETVALYAQGLCGQVAGQWRMTALDADGCDLAAGERVTRLPFTPPLGDPSTARDALVILAERARAAIMG